MISQKQCMLVFEGWLLPVFMLQVCGYYKLVSQISTWILCFMFSPCQQEVELLFKSSGCLSLCRTSVLFLPYLCVCWCLFLFLKLGLRIGCCVYIFSMYLCVIFWWNYDRLLACWILQHLHILQVIPLPVFFPADLVILFCRVNPGLRNTGLLVTFLLLSKKSVNMLPHALLWYM